MNKFIETDSDNYLKFDFSTSDSPECIMSLRSAGGMGRNTDPETAERRNFLEKTGVEDYFKLNQTHSRIVHNAADLGSADNVVEGDGLYSFSRENILAVTAADCMPVFFFSRSEGVFGVLHSGWKGTGISIEAVQEIEKDAGRQIDDFEFILGPSIGSCCYEVDRDRAEVFENLYGSDSVVTRDNSGYKKESGKRYYLDLIKANTAVLDKKGIKNIKIIENCTCCSENFYSFRGDGPKQFRLMLALIGYFR